jgi:hypothetical protein
MMSKCQIYIQVHLHHTNVLSTLEFCTSCLFLCLTKVYIYTYCTYTCICWITFYDTVFRICKVMHKFVTFSLCCKIMFPHMLLSQHTTLIHFFFESDPFTSFFRQGCDCLSTTLSNARKLYN